MMKRSPEEKALRDSWQTPDWVLSYAEALIGDVFAYDLAASPGNAIAPYYFTAARPYEYQRDRLRAPAWLNPPFSNLGGCVHRAVYGYQNRMIPALVVLTLGDISTSYWAQLQSHGAIHVPIIGRWSCVPPPGLSASQSKVAFALWILAPNIHTAPEPAHWRDIQQTFGTPRPRY